MSKKRHRALNFAEGRLKIKNIVINKFENGTIQASKQEKTAGKV